MFVFIAMPYSQLCDESYLLKSEYKDFCIKLTTKLKEIGCTYFLAHERENWGKEYSKDTESTEIDFNTISRCDLVCMIPGVPASGGVHVELGWASAAHKKINLFLQKDYFYSPMVTGIDVLTDARKYYYDSDYNEELVDIIIDSVKERMKENA